MSLNYHFGELLLKYLQSKGIQHKWLAEKLGVSNQAVAQYFEVRTPRKATAEKILSTLGITIEDLIDLEKQTKKVEEPQSNYQTQNNVSISMEQFQYFMEAVKERDALKQKEIEQLQKQNSREVPVPKVQD
ncbi:helix-turn-helix domain-containing protein [Emticicia sp. ODNR4P]|nr:helix-turn-helix domain-containing protein [Emticicia sp. ODNR4P]